MTTSGEVPLRAMGSTAAPLARVERPRTLAALQHLLRGGGRGAYSLVGARHSFGGQFQPTPGGAAIDTTGLGGSVTMLEENATGRRWVRVPASLTFEALAAATPGLLPRHPPTSDLITLGGALAACTHDSLGFFADHVRRFTLLGPDGRSYDCHADAEGTARELFELVPGSFGLLGVILDLEINLYSAPTTSAVDITVHRGRFEDGTAFAKLSALAADPSSQGAGLYVYGVGGPTVVFEAHVVDARTLEGVPWLPLTDDRTTRNVYLQGIASVAPRLTNAFSLAVLQDRRRFRAPIYGHAFFQRSYGRAHAILAGSGAPARALRLAGLDPRLPVAHQTFVFSPAVQPAFLRLYFDVLARYPDVVRRIEQQDSVRLTPCRWPLHASFGLDPGSFLLTTSIGVAGCAALATRAARFLAEVADRSYQQLGVKTLLLKQTHADPILLRAMHASMIARLAALKARVDPEGVLQSRWWAQLQPE